LGFGMLANPGYNSNSAATTYTVTSATWVELNGGTGSRFTFVLCKPQAVSVTMLVVCNGATAGYALAGIGIDTVTNPDVMAFSAAGAVLLLFASIVDNVKGVPLAIGTHYAAGLGAYLSVSPATFYADVGNLRAGSNKDPIGTSVSAIILM
jgi:hypothetical protein